MIPISSAVSSSLTWKKISHLRSYELRQNNEVAGTLQRPSFWSPNFVAETPSGSWTFRCCGFFGNGCEIVDEASQQVVATFKASWGAGGGVLSFRDAQTFQLEVHGWWRPVWTVVGDGGMTAIRLHVRERTVEVLPSSGLPEPRLTLLLMFTWYRVLKAEEDAASAAVVAAVS